MKDVDRHLFFGKVKSLGIDSCQYEIPKNNLVDDMKLWPTVTFPDVYSTVTSSKRRETSLWDSWKHTTLWFPGGSTHYRSWSANLDRNFDGIDVVLIRKSWHYFVQITRLVISNMGWPSVSGEPQPRAFRGWKLGYELHHRRTQDFTMEEVHVVGGMVAGLGASPPVGRRGKAPIEGLWGRSPRSWRKMWN